MILLSSIILMKLPYLVLSSACGCFGCRGVVCIDRVVCICSYIVMPDSDCRVVEWINLQQQLVERNYQSALNRLKELDKVRINLY